MAGTAPQRDRRGSFTPTRIWRLATFRVSLSTPPSASTNIPLHPSYLLRFGVPSAPSSRHPALLLPGPLKSRGDHRTPSPQVTTFQHSWVVLRVVRPLYRFTLTTKVCSSLRLHLGHGQRPRRSADISRVRPLGGLTQSLRCGSPNPQWKGKMKTIFVFCF